MDEHNSANPAGRTLQRIIRCADNYLSREDVSNSQFETNGQQAVVFYLFSEVRNEGSLPVYRVSGEASHFSMNPMR